MRLYEGTISEFNHDVLENKAADRISASYQKYYRRRVSPSEYRAWQQSLNFLKNSFEYSSLTNNRLIVEYELPYSTRRIDVLVFGQPPQGRLGKVIFTQHAQDAAKTNSIALINSADLYAVLCGVLDGEIRDLKAVRDPSG